MVCRRLRRLCTNGSLWKRLVLLRRCSRFPRRMAAAAKRLLARCSPHLQSLDLGRREDSFSLGAKALRSCPNLKKILGYEERHDDTLLRSFLHCVKYSKSLRRLELFFSCDARSLVEEAECLRNLTSIVLRVSSTAEHQAHVRDAGLLRSVAEHCRSLRQLECHYETSEVGDLEMTHFLERTRGALTDLIFPAVRLTDGSLQTIEICHLLKRLHLVNAGGLGWQGLSAITGLHNLQDLKLAGCRQLEGDNNVNNIVLYEMRNLTRLSIHDCERLGDQGLMIIADACLGLRYLDLEGGCRVTNIGVQWVMRRCWRLKVLRMRRMGEGVTHEAFVEEEVERSGLEELVLHRKASYYLSMAEREVVWKAIPSLRSLDGWRRPRRAMST